MTLEVTLDSPPNSKGRRGERDDVSAHTQNLYVTQRRICSSALRHVTSRDVAGEIFYTILKRLPYTGILTETCRACPKTPKDANIDHTDPNNKWSLKETVLGSPVPARTHGISGTHIHPTHSMYFSR